MQEMRKLVHTADARIQVMETSNAELKSSLSQIENDVIKLKEVIVPANYHGKLKQEGVRCFVHRWSAPGHQNILIRILWCTGSLHRWTKQCREVASQRSKKWRDPVHVTAGKCNYKLKSRKAPDIKFRLQLRLGFPTRSGIIFLRRAFSRLSDRYKLLAYPGVSWRHSQPSKIWVFSWTLIIWCQHAVSGLMDCLTVLRHFVRVKKLKARYSR